MRTNKMIEVIKGNIFTTECQTIVNTINCVGVMGAGIALECRLRHPEMYKKYKDLCEEKKINIGLLWIYKTENKWILNFPTKKHWKYPSKEEYLHDGLKKFMETYKGRGIKSVAFPLLGADKGGMDADKSLQIMTSYLEDADIKVEIYQYDHSSKDDIYEQTKEWLLAQDLEFVSSSSKLRRDYIVKVLDAMRRPDIVQLNQLAKVKGVGIKTLEKIYALSSCEKNDQLDDSMRQEKLI
jgi:O-acetyl-ADP-ribose deacetylase (regulator of RNase III)